ncbi:MAG: DUF5678 domain-containing protein [Actinomycetota bacterium]
MTKSEVAELRKLDRKILKEFRGKWVARDGLKIVAVADSLQDVLKTARAKGVKKPIVRQVPEETRRYSFY